MEAPFVFFLFRLKSTTPSLANLFMASSYDLRKKRQALEAVEESRNQDMWNEQFRK